MNNYSSPIRTQAWKQLVALSQKMDLKSWKSITLNENRALQFQVEMPDFVLNYARNPINMEIMQALENLFDETGVKEGRNQMFSGAFINETENRAVLHTALRNPLRKGLEVAGIDVLQQIHSVLDRMERFSNEIISGLHLGFDGRSISDIVNIGIGGSDLGPYMVYEALYAYRKRGLKAHFVSNVDAAHLGRLLMDLNPATTLFIIASKTFTTQETMANAKSARKWFLTHGGNESDIAMHFVALSTNISAAREFGIEEENIFGFWDWVGGRYSLWSAIGLSVCCTLGFDVFKELLDGGHEMDNHFLSKPFQQNMPMILAALGIWNSNFLGYTSHAILPYDQNLHRLPAFLQQADMESNGKSVDRNGCKVEYSTGPIIWGEPGTNGQHAFYQLIHQGTHIIPCDFLASAKTHYQLDNQHELLLSNFLAQPQALMNGLAEQDVLENLKKEDLSEERIQKLLPFRVFEGNRPSNILFYKLLTPQQLGRLIAMYEHKIFVQGWVWNIFSFDQWGVELGKKIANQVLKGLNNHTQIGIDPINSQIISLYRKWK